VTPDEPQPKPPWELKTKWVIATAVALWLFGVVGLIVYLLGNRQP
jgi:preprotein translocase subunit Sss1